MVKIEIHEFIKRPAHEIFDYFSDPANLSQWQSFTEYAEWISKGEPGIGSKFKVVINIAGARTAAVMQVTIWERPNRYGFTSIDIPFPVKKLEGVTTLTPNADGTHLAFKGQIAFSVLFKLGESLVSKQVHKQDGDNIIAMKQVLESGYQLHM
jgi:hypothetical protein